MSFALLGLAVLAAAVAGWMLLRPRGAGPASAASASAAAAAARSRSQTARAAPGPAQVAEPVPAGAAAAAPSLPPRLAAFVPTALEALPAERRTQLSAELRRIPRPPPGLQELTSPAFLERASSTELGELIMVEARIAAKVLATVNSPFYGLRRPVSSVGQAVTFLGLNSVRGICLQAMLDASFNSGRPEQRRLFDTLWRASAIASELCARLAPRLGLPAQGTLVTQVVLSFLGHGACAALMSRHHADWTLKRSLLGRAEAEQARLGLSAAGIGSLLMRDWGLPDSIADEVAAIDAMLVTPAHAVAGRHSASLALCYLCARLGERLATGAMTDLAGFDPAADPSEEFFHLRSHLQTPALARLAEHLHSPEITQALGGLARRAEAAAHA
jgi:HD-like signal output (HDOD) protein